MLLFKRLLIMGPALFYCCAFCFAQDAGRVLRGRVKSIEDGNTIVVSAGDDSLRLRLVGVDAPSQALSKKAREGLSALVRGKDVSVLLAPLEIQEGKHRSSLGKVTAGGLDVGLEQIRSGFAWQTKKHEQYQTRDDIRLYKEAEEEAAAAKRGVWGEGLVECRDAPVKTAVGAGAGPRVKDAGLPAVFGTVVVEVTVVGGMVTAARALCGHPVLQTVAARAALRAKYQPEPGIITGKMVYNFVPGEPPPPR